MFQSDLDELTTGYDQRFLEIASQLENFDKRLAARKSTIEFAIPDELVAITGRGETPERNRGTA